MTRMPQLDGLRALAVLCVLFCHSSDSDWVCLGPFGVRLFFVISGYLITGILLRHRGSAPGHALRAFYARRLLRIFPLYYVALAVYFLLDVPAARQLWPWLVTYTSNVQPVLEPGTDAAFVSHFWSLAVEEQFYLAWPLLMLFLPRRMVPICIMTANLVGPLSRALSVFLFPDQASAWLQTTPACLDALGLGALLAHRGLRPATSKLLALSALAPFTAYFALQGMFPTTLVPWLHHALEPFLESVVALLLVEHAAAGRLHRVLTTRPLLYLGTISYGIYVWHGLVCSRLFTERGLEHFLALSGLSILLASASWHLFERRLTELKDFLPYRPARSRKPPIPTVPVLPHVALGSYNSASAAR